MAIPIEAALRCHSIETTIVHSAANTVLINHWIAGFLTAEEMKVIPPGDAEFGVSQCLLGTTPSTSNTKQPNVNTTCRILTLWEFEPNQTATRQYKNRIES